MSVLESIKQTRTPKNSIVNTPAYKTLTQRAYEHSVWAIEIVSNVAMLGDNTSDTRWFTTTNRDIRVMATRMAGTSEIIYTIGNSRDGRYGHKVQTTSCRNEAQRMVYFATLIG